MLHAHNCSTHFHANAKCDCQAKPHLYASLVGPLLGLYYPMPAELPDEDSCRAALASSRLAKLWCSFYTEEQVDECITKWGGHKLEARYAGLLEYNQFAVAAVAAGGKPLPGGQHYVMQPDGHNMLCNADGTRSIFDDIDE